MSTETCAGHDHVATELRALALAVLDRLQLALERTRADETGASSSQPSPCLACPVCAVLAVLRGERPDLLARLAEHATGILTVLRAALTEETSATGRPPAGEPEPHGTRPVQRIRVERRAAPGG